jgi:hypothetical protein
MRRRARHSPLPPQVVVVKMNPVNDYLGPLLRRAFAPFVDAGYVEFAYGGAGDPGGEAGAAAPPGWARLPMDSATARARHSSLHPAAPRLRAPLCCPHTNHPAVGKALCEHPVVASIHLTGSADTYNAIVWGGRDAPVRGCGVGWGGVGWGGVGWEGGPKPRRRRRGCDLPGRRAAQTAATP